MFSSAQRSGTSGHGRTDGLDCTRTCFGRCRRVAVHPADSSSLHAFSTLVPLASGSDRSASNVSGTRDSQFHAGRNRGSAATCNYGRDRLRSGAAGGCWPPSLLTCECPARAAANTKAAVDRHHSAGATHVAALDHPTYRARPQPDLKVTGNCQAASGHESYYNNVNILKGGNLSVPRTGCERRWNKNETHFWANSIIIEKRRTAAIDRPARAETFGRDERHGRCPTAIPMAAR